MLPVPQHAALLIFMCCGAIIAFATIAAKNLLKLLRKETRKTKPKDLGACLLLFVLLC
jgi:hypothetical protein